MYKSKKEAAIEYAKRGWQIFTVKPNIRGPMPHWRLMVIMQLLMIRPLLRNGGVSVLMQTSV